jgi:hypothetical protein
MRPIEPKSTRLRLPFCETATRAMKRPPSSASVSRSSRSASSPRRELLLVHDEEAQAFYSPEGNLAISREQVDLRYIFSAIGTPEREIEDLSE